MVVDKETSTAAAKLLEDALRLMNDSGKHWIKRNYKVWKKFNGKEEECFCAVGAIRSAYGENYLQLSERDNKNYSSFTAANKFLLETINEIPLKKTGKYQSIEQWNDSPLNTWKNVERTFEKARQKLLQM